MVVQRVHSQLVVGLRRPAMANRLLMTCVLSLLALVNPIDSLAQEARGELSCSPRFQPADGNYQFTGGEYPELFADGDQSEIEIGEIYFTRLPIFNTANPAENNWLFRWANRFHTLTQEKTLSRELLFAEGERVPARLLDESARNLRDQNFLHDVDIRPVSHCGDSVDVEVISKDNWSLTPTLSFDRVGGETTYSVGLRDTNLLGRGEFLTLKTGKDLDRNSTELVYQDNNVGGTRIRSRVSLVDSDDGNTGAFNLGLPFYALDSRFAWGVHLLDDERQDQQFQHGVEVSEVQHSLEDHGIELGFSSGLKNGVTRRWKVGFRHEQDQFALSSDLPPPAVFPRDRQMDYLFVGFEAVEDSYTTAFNLDQIYRTEDLHLGYELSMSAGYASTAFGSDQRRLILRGKYQHSLRFLADRYWLHELEWEGFYNQDKREAEDILVRYENRYYHRQVENFSFFARAEAVYSKNLNSYRQLVLGSNTGARGYENRFQTGDKRFLLTLEERWYSNLHLWNLLRVGAAAFIDTGRAWSTDDTALQQNSDWLANFGLGLRLASSKAASSRIAHLDFAFPLTRTGEQGVDSMLINLTIKGRF